MHVYTCKNMYKSGFDTVNSNIFSDVCDDSMIDYYFVRGFINALGYKIGLAQLNDQKCYKHDSFTCVAVFR